MRDSECTIRLFDKRDSPFSIARMPFRTSLLIQVFKQGAIKGKVIKVLQKLMAGMKYLNSSVKTVKLLFERYFLGRRI